MTKSIKPRQGRLAFDRANRRRIAHRKRDGTFIYGCQMGNLRGNPIIDHEAVATNPAKHLNRDTMLVCGVAERGPIIVLDTYDSAARTLGKQRFDGTSLPRIGEDAADASGHAALGQGDRETSFGNVMSGANQTEIREIRKQINQRLLVFESQIRGRSGRYPVLDTQILARSETEDSVSQ